MTGIDGYDWASVGWSNPIPGDPDVSRQIAGQIQDLSDEVGRQNYLLSSVGPESAGFWSGPAADAFQPIAQKLPPELQKLVSSYGDAAAAINGYWPEHQSAQSLAVRALAKAQTAHQAIGAAQQQVGTLQGQSSSAGQAYNQASTKAANPPAGSTPDPNAAANVSNLQTQYQATQRQLGDAQSALHSAQGDLSAAEGMRQQAIDHWNTAASALAGHLHDASSAGIHNIHRGLFGSISHDIGSLVSSGTHGLESFAKAQIAAVVKTGEDIGHMAEDAGHYAEDGYSAVAHFAKDNMAILKSIDTVLNYVSTGLGVLAIVCQPIPGLDAIVDVASDTVLLAKTADDGLELMGGDQAAEGELVEDAVGLATAGTSKILDGAADDARTAANVGEDGEDATKVTTATEDVAHGAGTDADAAGGAGAPKGGDDDDAGTAGGDGRASDEDAGGGPARSERDTAGGPGGSGDEDAGGSTPEETGTPSPASSEHSATPTPAGSDDGQMPPSHEAGSPPAADEHPDAPTAARPDADSAPLPSDPPATTPATTPAASAHAEPAPPGKIGTLLGKRDYQEFIKAKNSGHFLHAMDENGQQIKYADSLATKLQQTTTGRFHVARTIMTAREDTETIHDADKTVHTWVTDHFGDHPAGQDSGDDDKLDAAFAEKLVLG